MRKTIPLPKHILGSGEKHILRANGDSMIEAGIDATLSLSADKSDTMPENIPAATIQFAEYIKLNKTEDS